MVHTGRHAAHQRKHTVERAIKIGNLHGGFQPERMKNGRETSRSPTVHECVARIGDLLRTVSVAALTNRVILMNGRLHYRMQEVRRARSKDRPPGVRNATMWRMVALRNLAIMGAR